MSSEKIPEDVRRIEFMQVLKDAGYAMDIEGEWFLTSEGRKLQELFHLVTPRCIACNHTIQQQQAYDAPWQVCNACDQRYPPSLIKAASDPFDYACRLVTGEVIRFDHATIHGDYVTLECGSFFDAFADNDTPKAQRLPYPCPRGVDVRVADIVWCADAPQGS